MHHHHSRVARRAGDFAAAWVATVQMLHSSFLQTFQPQRTGVKINETNPGDLNLIQTPVGAHIIPAAVYLSYILIFLTNSSPTYGTYGDVHRAEGKRYLMTT